MSYIVVYQRADGSSGLEECTSLDLAVVAAERLRNVDSVEHPRILKTEEVKFDFRPYYRVEVAEESAGSTASRPTPLAEPSTYTTPPAPAPEAPATTSTLASATSLSSESSAPAADSLTTEPPAPDASTPEFSGDAATATAGAMSAVDTSDVAETTDEATSAPIDPWAAAEGSSIDYSLSTDEPAPPAPEPDDAPSEGAVEPEDMGAVSRGLFSKTSLPDPPKDTEDLGSLAEDINDAVAPRRGLFGR